MKRIPFRLKVPVGTPILLTSGFLTLDGLLAMAVEAKTGSDCSQQDIPLQFTNGVAHGSAAFFRQSSFGSQDMFRRIKPSDMMGIPAQVKGGAKNLAPLIDQDKGTYKSFQTTFMRAETDTVFWFGLGDPDGVLALLNFVQGIGRKASLGNGEIQHSNISIDEIEQDCSFSLFGRPARPLPVEMWMGGPAQHQLAAIKHPYWISKQVECVVPTRRFFRLEDMALQRLAA